jgi:hypothetical protein
MPELVECNVAQANTIGSSMEKEHGTTVVELRLSYRYVKEYSWVVQAVNGFLSAYYMEHPSFRVQRHFDELESGMHVWLCEVPSTMKMRSLLRRLQPDLPPFRYSQTEAELSGHPQFVIDCPQPEMDRHL